MMMEELIRVLEATNQHARRTDYAGERHSANIQAEVQSINSNLYNRI